MYGLRNFIKPQSAKKCETVINKDLGILKKEKKKIKWRWFKNGKNYERCLYGVNGIIQLVILFLQIRPSHNIDYYILIGFEDLNMYTVLRFQLKNYTVLHMVACVMEQRG